MTRHLKVISDQSAKYLPIILTNIPQENHNKVTYTFQYRFNRELARTCAKFEFQQVVIPHSVIDLEDKFTRSQIDSLTAVLSELSQSKKISITLVTIDDYFPDTNITDFSNRNRERWGKGEIFEKGNVIIALSTSKKQFSISTSDVSRKFLPDSKCAEINSLVIPYFKKGEYFEGLLKGLEEIKNSLTKESLVTLDKK